MNNPEKKLPDSVGQWVNDKGEWCTLGLSSTGFWYVSTSNSLQVASARRVYALDDAGISPGRWKLAVSPVFEELPPKPAAAPVYQCCVTFGCGPVWRTFDSDGRCVDLNNHGARARDYRVIPHPDNDPEAVRIIEEAS